MQSHRHHFGWPPSKDTPERSLVKESIVKGLSIEKGLVNSKLWLLPNMRESGLYWWKGVSKQPSLTGRGGGGGGGNRVVVEGS